MPLSIEPLLPNGRQPDNTSENAPTLKALLERVRELETLCGEVYVAAVELGLPQPLLNRLWTVAAHGAMPHAYQIDLPPHPAGPAPVAATAPAKKPAPPPIPDIALIDRPKSPDAPRVQQPELKPLADRRTVLVVDDDPMMLKVLGRILQRENYALLTAPSGPDALRMAATHAGAIDLLITDYAMPEMHGRELAEKMRERYPAIKVLYQTGFSDMLFDDRAELEDGSAFVEKPFTARGLREAARLILLGSLNPA